MRRAKLMAHEKFPELVDHVRMKVDGFTAAEAKDWEKTEFREEVTGAFKRLTDAPDEMQVEGEEIRAEIERQAIAAGQTTAAANWQGILIAERYVTRAARSEGQVTAKQLFEEEGLQILGPEPHHFAHAKASRIGHSEDRQVLGVLDRGQKAL